MKAPTSKKTTEGAGWTSRTGPSPDIAHATAAEVLTVPEVVIEIASSKNLSLDNKFTPIK